MKQDAEKGSALLIVFVLAAIVAIMLYMEMPVTVFEAQRQREQMTIDHGKEYAHAVKLFVRKIGRYPSSLDELQNTNNMRFLRHKFKDPFTGDDDWRLLHAGPGGVIIDSKVKSATTSTFQGNTSAAGFGSNNGNTANSTNSAANSTGSASASSNTNANSGSSEPDFPMAGSIAAEATASVQPIAPKRPPAVAANGSKAASSDQSTWQSLLPPIPGEPNDSSGQPNGSTANPGSTPAMAGNAQSSNPTAGEPANAGLGAHQSTAANMQNMVSQMSGAGGQTNTGSTGGTSGVGAGATGIASGGVAGVAVPDKVAGVGIKAVNDQHKYKLWEFYYDPTQDTLKMPTAQSAQGTANQNQTGTSAFGNNSGSAFGSSFGSQPGNANANSSGTSTTAPGVNSTTQQPPQ